MTTRVLLRWGMVTAYAGLIFVISAQSRVPNVGSDKVAHLIEYSVLAVLIMRALSVDLRAMTPMTGGVAWFAASLYGISDEWHQSFVPGRHASARDALADSAGAGIAAVFMLVVVGWRRRSARLRTVAGGGGE